MYPDIIINEIPKVSAAETLDIIARAKDRIERDIEGNKEKKDKKDRQYLRRVLDVLNDSEKTVRKAATFEAVLDLEIEKLR